LSVADKRMQIRNLPKREFYEKELKELIVTVVAAFETKTKKKVGNVIQQVKVLRDQDKTYIQPETEHLVKLSSGIAFVEFYDPEVALFAVRYLNNM